MMVPSGKSLRYCVIGKSEAPADRGDVHPDGVSISLWREEAPFEVPPAHHFLWRPDRRSLRTAGF